MEPRILTDEEYATLKKKLHQAHDKVIKVTLHEKPAMQELMEKIVMRLLIGFKIDLASLKLDTTTYIRQNLEVFFLMSSIWQPLLMKQQAHHNRLKWVF